MQRIILCFLFALGAETAFAEGGWFWQNPLPQGNELSALTVIDANTAVAVGEAGTILRTTDGGATWINQRSGSKSWLFGVDFTDPNHGVAVGNFVTMVRTTDGGASWIETQMPTNLLAVTFSDANIGTAVGLGGNHHAHYRRRRNLESPNHPGDKPPLWGFLQRR